MSAVVYNYNIIDPETGTFIDRPIKLNILINCQVKLVVIDDNYDSEGGVVDSSSTFFNANLSFGGGRELGVGVPKEEVTKNLYQLRIDVTDIMGKSEAFKSFWAKWSEKCGERGHDPQKYADGISGPYFGLQIIQTFKGNADFAGFAHTDYLFVPYFGNKGEKCTIKYCEGAYFDFLNTTSDTISLRLLKFDTQAIVEKQVQVAQERINFEETIKNYQAQLIAQSDELILSTYDYQPTNFTYVITRLLEFQQGTLISSLDFAENANLTQLYNLLGPVNGISYEIDSLAGLYPEITIEDGEGIPYGDGIPGVYEFFGWGFNGINDIFSVVNKDETSISNYGIITRNGTEILDTRDFTPSLAGYEYFVPIDNYVEWGKFNEGDIIECTITVTDYVEDTVNFVKSNYGYETDSVSSGVTITRGLNGGIYNSLIESGWDSGVSPSGTTWNSIFNAAGGDYGWSDLVNVDSRTFGTFYDALNNAIGSNIIGLELVMYDETTDEYWAVKFTSWTQGQNEQSQGGGFEYNRRLINQTGSTLTFKDTLVWK
jgi:hypothetical protein